MDENPTSDPRGFRERLKELTIEEMVAIKMGADGSDEPARQLTNLTSALADALVICTASVTKGSPEVFSEIIEQTIVFIRARARKIADFTGGGMDGASNVKH